jgi:hypothetical protein
MLGVTVFGIFLTPVFYYVLEWLGGSTNGESVPATATPMLKAVTDNHPDGVVTSITKEKA